MREAIVHPSTSVVLWSHDPFRWFVQTFPFLALEDNLPDMLARSLEAPRQGQIEIEAEC